MTKPKTKKPAGLTCNWCGAAGVELGCRACSLGLRRRKRSTVLRMMGEPLDRRVRNYEMESWLSNVHGGLWCISEPCPFNGMSCLFGKVSAGTWSELRAHIQTQKAAFRRQDQTMTKPKTKKPAKPKAPPKEYPGLRVGFMLARPDDPMSVRVVDEDAPPESGPMLRAVK